MGLDPGIFIQIQLGSKMNKAKSGERYDSESTTNSVFFSATESLRGHFLVP